MTAVIAWLAILAIEAFEIVFPGTDGATMEVDDPSPFVLGLVASLPPFVCALIIWWTMRPVRRQWLAFASGALGWGLIRVLYTLTNFAFAYRWADGQTMWDVAPDIVAADLGRAIFRAVIAGTLVAVFERRDLARARQTTVGAFD